MVITVRDTEIKAGYKQTEVGVIPMDWEVRTLSDEIDQLEAGVSVNSVDEEFHVYAHEQAILKTSSVSNGYFLPHENKKIAPRDIKRAKLNPRVDSIIISRMNTPDLVGECGYVEKDYQDLFLPDRLWMTHFKRESKINVKWLSYLLSYREYKVKIKLAATGTSGSMKNISKNSLLSISIPFPSPEEQTAIATALSDVDALITSLDKLIAKKRDIKQATMQQLLTGKTRLPGFGDKLKPGYKRTEIGVIPEDWKLKSFRDVCRVNQGLQIAIENRLKNPTEKSKIYITIQYLNAGKEVEYIDNYTASVCCDKDDVLMTRTGNTGVVISGVEGVFHNNFFKVNYDRGIIDKDFLVSYLKLKRTQDIILIKAGTSTIPDLNHNDFYSIPIPLPTKSEQQAIATILTDMDAEITALEQKRDKTRALKQGMMQELLTGKTRLV